MKKAIILAAIMLLGSFSAMAQNAADIYKKYSGEQGASCIYISESMFKMIGTIPEIPLDDGVNLSPYLKSMKSLYLVTSSRGADLTADVEKLVASGKHELLMEVHDDGENVRIYVRKNKDMITNFVFLAQEDSGENIFICLDGEISESDFHTLLAAAMQG